MKQTIFFLIAIVIFSNCQNSNQKYQEIYTKWSKEITTIDEEHSQATSIMESFRKKIDNHKARIKDFNAFIEGDEQDIAKLKGQNKLEKESETESDIMARYNENIKKHKHFTIFLNNLTALQGMFENRPFTLQAIPEDIGVAQFTSVNDANIFWMELTQQINSGHDSALAIIDELEKHIEHHKKEIAQFTEKLESLKEQQDNAPESLKKEELEVIEKDLTENYSVNKKKHEHFVTFLKGLTEVKKQFE